MIAFVMYVQYCNNSSSMRQGDYERSFVADIPAEGGRVKREESARTANKRTVFCLIVYTCWRSTSSHNSPSVPSVVNYQVFVRGIRLIAFAV